MKKILKTSFIIAATCSAVLSNNALALSNYAPYMLSSPMGNDLGNKWSQSMANGTYVSTKYGVNDVYTGFVFSTTKGCNFKDMTVFSSGNPFNPLTYGGRNNFASSSSGNITFVIGGNPGNGGNSDYLDTCDEAGFKSLIEEIIQSFNTPQYNGKLVGIDFDVENSSFHDGSAWKKIANVLPLLQEKNIKVSITLPYITSYWEKGWRNQNFKNFVNSNISQVHEFNIMTVGYNDKYYFPNGWTPAQIKKDVEAAKGYLSEYTRNTFPQSKLAFMIDVSEKGVTSDNVKNLLNYQKTNDLYGIHLFTINRDAGYDINTGEFNPQLVSNYQKILDGQT